VSDDPTQLPVADDQPHLADAPPPDVIRSTEPLSTPAGKVTAAPAAPKAILVVVVAVIMLVIGFMGVVFVLLAE
jgi:hypothetical protein